VIAVAVQARGRDQRGQTLDQLQRCQPQLGTPIGLRLVEAIDERTLAELLEALQRNGRPRAIAQQPFQAGAVGAFDADRSIQRKASAVISARHVARIGSIEMAGTGEPTQHPSPHLLLHCGEILWPQRGRLGELDLPVGAGNEQPVDYPAVEVDMRIQRAAEALHETHRPPFARAHSR